MVPQILFNVSEEGKGESDVEGRKKGLCGIWDTVCCQEEEQKEKE
jgi:hypothetical protein